MQFFSNNQLLKSFRFVLAIAVLIIPFSNSHAQNKTHLSSDKIFMLTYPPMWKINKMESANSELALNTPSHSMFKPCMVKMVITPVIEAYKGSSLKELAETETKMLKATAKEQNNLELLTSEFKQINKKEWWVVYGKMNQGKTVYYVHNYKTLHSDKLYTITYISPEKTFETYTKDALHLVESIEWLTKDATVPQKKVSTE